MAFYYSGSCLTKIHGGALEMNVCLCVCVKKVKILVPPIPSFNYSIVLLSTYGLFRQTIIINIYLLRGKKGVVF